MKDIKKMARITKTPNTKSMTFRIPPYRVITTEQIAELLEGIKIGAQHHWEVINTRFKLTRWMGSYGVYIWDKKAEHMFQTLGIENKWL